MFTNQNKFKDHLYFMRLALFQAYKNLGNTKENPSVGCIITKRNLVINVVVLIVIKTIALYQPSCVGFSLERI